MRLVEQTFGLHCLQARHGHRLTRGEGVAGQVLANAKAGEKAYVAVSAVDLGILNLTKFPIPDPEGWFFGQRRLTFRKSAMGFSDERIFPVGQRARSIGGQCGFFFGQRALRLVGQSRNLLGDRPLCFSRKRRLLGGNRLLHFRNQRMLSLRERSPRLFRERFLSLGERALCLNAQANGFLRKTTRVRDRRFLLYERPLNFCRETFTQSAFLYFGRPISHVSGG